MEDKKNKKIINKIVDFVKNNQEKVDYECVFQISKMLEFDDDEYDSLMEQLNAEGIDFFDTNNQDMVEFFLTDENVEDISKEIKDKELFSKKNFKDDNFTCDPVYLYMKDIGRLKTLTQEEETFYSKIIHESKIEISKEICKYPFILEELISSASIKRFIFDKGSDNFCSTEEEIAINDKELNQFLEKIKDKYEKYKNIINDYISGKINNRKYNFDKLNYTRGIYNIIELMPIKFYSLWKIWNTWLQKYDLKNKISSLSQKMPNDFIQGTGFTTRYALEKSLEKISQLEEKLNEAKNKLVEGNMFFVGYVAKKYTYRGLDYLDMIQEGNKGLLKAVERYNLNRGTRFTTYAINWIRQSIMKAVADQSKSVRIPMHIMNDIGKLKKILAKMRHERGENVSIDEISEALGASVDKLESIFRLTNETISLDEPINDETGTSLIDVLKDEQEDDPGKKVMKIILFEKLRELIFSLGKKEGQIISMRYGLNEKGEYYTLQDVGEKLNLTRERVRQIEFKALKKLKSSKKKEELEKILNLL